MIEDIFVQKAKEYIKNSRGNYIQQDKAIKGKYVGERIFDEPIFGFAWAQDPLFNDMLKEEAVGTHFMEPIKWIPEAKTVISIFLPFAKNIIKSNEVDEYYPSDLWLHGRIEGQSFINEFSEYLRDLLIDEGFYAVAPSIDKRMKMIEKPGSSPEFQNKDKGFTSNWSERHVAYIAGLGTFGLSKGIITERGMAGRLTSIVSDIKFPITKRKYDELYEYCTMCGACIRRCPVDAISIESGKDHLSCSEMLDSTKKKSAPRYGCGKCQVRVPCATENPSK